MKYKCYHGTKSKFESFSPEYLGKGIDQYGSGYYFATSKNVADGYASPSGYVITAIININKPIIIDGETNKGPKDLTISQIHKLILSANNLENYINANYDTDYESRSVILSQIFENYKPTGELIRTLNIIAKDIYGYDTSDIQNFNNNLKHITGYDGIIVKHPIGDIIIALFLDQISIINIEEYHSINESFIGFLNEIGKSDPILIENITNAFNYCFKNI